MANVGKSPDTSMPTFWRTCCTEGFVNRSFERLSESQQDPESSSSRRDPEDRRVVNQDELKDNLPCPFRFAIAWASSRLAPVPTTPPVSIEIGTQLPEAIILYRPAPLMYSRQYRSRTRATDRELAQPVPLPMESTPTQFFGSLLGIVFIAPLANDILQKPKFIPDQSG
jgi:hypothetical protein